MGPAELRAYVVYHALFRGRLAVGDSQILNNPSLRAGVGAANDIAGETFRPDLLELLDAGHLRVAIRDDKTLANVSEQLRTEGVVTTDDLDYVDSVSAAADPHCLRYSAGHVGAAFTQGVREYLESAPDHHLTPSNRERLRFFVEEETTGDDPLKFNRLKQWVDKARADHVLSAQELATVMSEVGHVYRYGLPLALNLDTDFPSDKSDVEKALAAEEVDDVAEAMVPAFVVSQDFLRDVPAGAVNDVLADSAAQDYFSILRRAQDKTAGLNDFVAAMENYADAIDRLRVTYAVKGAANALKRPRVRVKIVAGGVGLIIAGLVVNDLTPTLLWGEAAVGLELLRTGVEAARRPAKEFELLNAAALAGSDAVAKTPIFLTRPPRAASRRPPSLR